MFLRIVTIEIALLNACRINWSRITDFFCFPGRREARRGAATKGRRSTTSILGVLKTGEPGTRP